MPKLNDDQQAFRRGRILDAAERCFARSGFHATTMQAICADAGVSPGALYLYFSSKDDLIAGLAERDRALLAADFATLHGTDDFLVAFEALGRKCLVEEPREKSVMTLAIWAEGTRDPAMAAICRGFQSDVAIALRGLFGEARARGQMTSGVPVETAADLLLTLVEGLIKRRALEDDFDAEAGLAMVMSVLDALFAGRIALGGAAARSVASHVVPSPVASRSESVA